MTTRTVSPLPLPSHYQPADAGRWGYRPDEAMLATTAADWRAQHQVRPAASDERRVHLLLIDVQKDFCFPEGSLYVAGRSGTAAVAADDPLLAWRTEFPALESCVHLISHSLGCVPAKAEEDLSLIHI